MATTSDIDIQEGAVPTAHVATFDITEDAETKKVQRIALTDSAGADLSGTKADAADTHTDATAISWTSIFKQISKSVQALVTGRSALFNTGTGGFIKTPFALLNTSDTGLNALASGAAVTSAHGGGNTNGIFSQTDFGSAKKMLLWLNVVTAGWTPTAGGCLSGWWLQSTDGGTTFESLVSTPSTTVPALPRPPDFTLSVYEGGTALSAGNIKFSGVVAAPAPGCKLVIQNNTGAAFGAGAHTLFCGPIAELI